MTVAKSKYATGEAVRTAAADHFKIDQKQMADLVEYWQHINCSHAAIPGYAVPDAALDAATGDALTPLPTSAFAADVALHVILHELGHAVIREFDLMVLGNEETMADAFATYLLTQHLPDRALPAITARVTSLMIEANEVPRDQWTVRGEHDSDARRAYQIAALAVAADQKKYASVAEIVGMSEREIRMAHDYGADIHRAWRRTLTPLMMPEGSDQQKLGFARTRPPNSSLSSESQASSPRSNRRSRASTGTRRLRSSSYQARAARRGTVANARSP